MKKQAVLYDCIITCIRPTLFEVSLIQFKKRWEKEKKKMKYF